MLDFIDLVAIATIADVMPLTEFNHTIVKVGLKYFIKNSRVANQVFINHLFPEHFHITSEDIAFQIAPRLNSSGRMQDAILSFQFLTSNDYLEATHLFYTIDKLNSQRREIEKTIFQMAIDEVDNSKPIIIIKGEELHEGVIGIVASRLVEKFQKPTFIFSQNGDILKGSGRSLGNIDIYYLLQKSSHLLLKWGGHKMAGGLSIHIKQFRKFQEVVYQTMKIYSTVDYLVNIDIFGELEPQELNLELFQVLNRFEPFGNGNEKPIFKLTDGQVVSAYRMGKENQYQKLVIQKNKTQIEVLIFKDLKNFQVGDYISFLYRPTLSSFRGELQVQALLEKVF